MMPARYESADACFLGVIAQVMEEGVDVEDTRELRGQTVVIANPRDRVVHARPLRHGYPAALLSWDLGGREDIASIEHWNPNAGRFSDDGLSAQGENYGRRWSGVLEEALR